MSERHDHNRAMLAFLADLRKQDILLWAEGERLRFSAPSGSLTPALRQELAARKQEILKFLSAAKQTSAAALPPIQPVPRDQPLPASFAQQRLVFLDQLQPENPFYNIATELRLTGLLNVEALHQSLHAIIRRHEALRTTFAITDDPTLQIIAPAMPVDLKIVDLQPLAEAERAPALRQFIWEEGHKLFNLTHGPLIRFALIHLTPADHVLLLTCHHIVIDAWSDDILLRELSVFYAAYLHGRPEEVAAQLPRLPIQYADYAVWQRQWLQSATAQAQLAYWKQQLAGMKQTLDLLTDRPRPPVPSLRGAVHQFVLPRSLADACTTLSRREGCTLFMTLLTAFQIVLYRYTGQTDISIGSPIANRQQPELEYVIGFFTNTLVLRADLAGNPSFLDLLRQVRGVTLDAYANQDLPFEQVVDALQPERDLSRHPLFQVMFVLQNRPQTSISLEHVTLELFEIATTTAKFDLTLELIETNEGLVGAFEYATDLFDATTIARLAQHFQTLLAGIVADPDQRIGLLPLLTDAERHHLLVTCQPTAAVAPVEQCLHQLVEAQVARTPHAVALVLDQDRLTYAELNTRANQLAQYLRRHGVKPDTRVGLYVARSLDLVIGMLAILKAGGAYVPIDPTYPVERVAFMVADMNAPVIVTQADLATKLHAEDTRHHATVICIDVDRDQIAQEHTDPVDVQIMPDHLAYVIYTSGSTGKPKGTLITHAQVVRLFHSTQPWFHFGPDDVWTLFHSAAFDFSVWEIWGALFCGGRLVMVPYLISREPAAFYELLCREHVTVLNQTPSAFRQLIHAEEAGDRSALALRLVIFGGEALELHSLRPWFTRHGDQQPQLVNMYGITETTVHVTYRPLQIADLDTSGSVIGGPIPDLHLYVLDQQQQLVPLGVAGELYVGGAGLARGYHARPALTAERFVPNPFSATPGARLYRSGDLGRFGANGDLEYLGRIDHQVKIRGFRIELGEIEAALLCDPDVRESVVVARSDPAGTPYLAAYVVPQPGVTLSVQALRNALRAELPEYMLPAVIVALPALPLTANGKIDRRALPDAYAQRVERDSTLVAPRDRLELILAQIWEELLNISPISTTDSFFDLGGHSLLAVRLMSRIRDRLGQQLPVAVLFQGATIQDLAARLRLRPDNRPQSPLVVLQPQGALQPFFCVHPVGGSVLCYIELARQLGTDRPFYAFQAPGIEGDEEPCTQVEELAARYVAAMRSAQSQGPYLLGGWSIGGVIAVEMAQQLAAQGDAVAQVLLLDSRADLYFDPDQRGDLDDLHVMIAFLEDIGSTTGRTFDAVPDVLAALEPAARLASLLHEARRAQVVPPDVGLDQIRHRLAVFQANLRAVARYVPATGNHALTVFRAVDEPDGTENDPSLGWAVRTSGIVSTVDVPGTHYTMLAAPHAAVLAERLRPCLDRAHKTGD